MKLDPAACAELPPVEVRSADVPSANSINAFSGRQPAGYYDPPHTHDRGQFSYRTQGFALVKTEGRSIFLSPGQGVWIPAGISHEVTCRGPAAYNAFYVAGATNPQLAHVRVIVVSPLLHALVDDALNDKLDDGAVREQLTTDLILDELARLPDVAAMAPIMPRSPGLRSLCDQLSRDPAISLDLDAWAVRAGMSRRNFTRLFRDETGLSAGEWHQRLRMHFADAWLAQGISLQKIAFRLGYGSTASFSRAYVRTFGASPLFRAKGEAHSARHT